MKKAEEYERFTDLDDDEMKVALSYDDDDAWVKFVISYSKGDEETEAHFTPDEALLIADLLKKYAKKGIRYNDR